MKNNFLFLCNKILLYENFSLKSNINICVSRENKMLWEYFVLSDNFFILYFKYTQFSAIWRESLKFIILYSMALQRVQDFNKSKLDLVYMWLLEWLLNTKFYGNEAFNLFYINKDCFFLSSSLKEWIVNWYLITSHQKWDKIWCKWN